LPHDAQRGIRLYRLARVAMANGRLPSTLPERAVGEYGDGSPCALCGEPTPDSELRIVLVDASRQLALHPACRSAWRIAAAEPDAGRDVEAGQQARGRTVGGAPGRS
jgi:hypothetical protein